MDDVENIKKSVGIRALAIRKRLGYESRELFAEVLEVHNNTVGFLERGETWLSPEMAIAYRDKFGIDPAEFLTEKPVIIQPTAKDALAIIAEIVEKFAEKPSRSDELSKLTQDPVVYEIALAAAKGYTGDKDHVKITDSVKNTKQK